MSPPELSADFPSLERAGAVVARLAATVDAAASGVLTASSSEVETALPGSATAEAFRSAVRAWAVVVHCVADDLRVIGWGVSATRDRLGRDDAALARDGRL
ncbi:MAG: hypothetical protein JWM93_2232 [Frankiales bacterium]|nr:hypothetical protein [Frankiales bacterium]